MEEVDLDLGLRSFHITGEEATPIVITASTTEDDKMRSNCLLGKLLIDRKDDIRTMRVVFHQSWGCNFELIRMRPNLFQIIFDSPNDAERVLKNGPWCFSNSLFCLQRWFEDWEARLDLFSSTEFWVHVVDLPYHRYTEEIGRQVAKALNVTGTCQLRTEQPSGRKLFRMRVPVDLRKPICRFVTLLINGTSLVGKLQYERLPHLCGHCGKWNHTVSFCLDVGRELTEEERCRLPYGEKQELIANRKSTLYREFRPVSSQVHSDTATGERNDTSCETNGTSFNETAGTISGQFKSTSETMERIPVQPLIAKKGEGVIGGRGSNASPTPISQLVVNFPLNVAPLITTMMQQILRNSMENIRDIALNQVNSGGDFSIGTGSRVNGGRRIHVNRGARHRDILMHNSTGVQVDMQRKRKSDDVVDGESSLKKTRLSITAPLVEPVEPQAHPAP